MFLSGYFLHKDVPTQDSSFVWEDCEVGEILFACHMISVWAYSYSIGPLWFRKNVKSLLKTSVSKMFEKSRKGSVMKIIYYFQSFCHFWRNKIILLKENIMNDFPISLINIYKYMLLKTVALWKSTSYKKPLMK